MMLHREDMAKSQNFPEGRGDIQTGPERADR